MVSRCPLSRCGRQEHGPQALAEALGLEIDESFPIRYDIRACVAVSSDSLFGSIEAEPVDRLSRAELIKLALS